ncbi:hypothetical protein R3W88_032140 [Solanum pinnatisectum]|uniref:Uncharacterized protein n=1 Tax=Solanum pinnatisectum TaxID=50273 RepID=A0AAV9LNK7_9SOLN|nr:hypothetical protein R3W88_032140 [Solanum pinnatisectum]
MSESFSSSSNMCKSVAKMHMLPTLDVIPNVNLMSSIYLPLLNLYFTFAEKTFFPWLKFRSLYQQKPKGVREYIAASKLDQHPILATQKEQFITLQISEDFPKQYNKYQYANLGTTKIILNAGTVFITLFPNINMSLYGPYLTKLLMIQVQIQGSPQDRDVIQATLHSQIVWRVQNHAMSLSHPSGENVLLLNIDAI